MVEVAETPMTKQMEHVGQKEDIGAAIGRIASGVYVVTASDAERKIGMLASWVQQVGFEPPTVSVAIHPDREIYKLIEKTGAFVVNVLSNENMSLMKNFGRYSPDQFSDVNYRECDCGPVLEETVASLHCKVLQKVAASDHYLLIAEVMDGKLQNNENPPMTHFRKSGFSY
jgi:flavin reductase (DIM6/NTAB) family NADH-FMN oxidoreductase RutF